MSFLPATTLFLLLGTLRAQEPADARGWLNQGVQAFRQAHYTEAVHAFQRAVDLDPSLPAARLYLATAYMQQFIPGVISPENEQMAANARENFSQLLIADPNNKVALASIASLSLNQKKWDEAQQWYERLIAADPNSADGYYTLGFIAWSKWYPDYQRARASLGMKPEDSGPIPNQAVRQDLRVRYGSVLDGGIWNLQKALSINPQYEDAMAYMNLLIQERADLLETVDEYRRDIAEADRWVQMAVEIKKQKAAQATAGRRSGFTEVAVPAQNPKLIRRVEPLYPPEALQAGISGIVRLSVIISKEGAVQNITVRSGHPLLVPPAIEAVKQWVYEPTLLNGIATAAFTEVELSFSPGTN